MASLTQVCLPLSADNPIQRQTLQFGDDTLADVVLDLLICTWKCIVRNNSKRHTKAILAGPIELLGTGIGDSAHDHSLSAVTVEKWCEEHSVLFSFVQLQTCLYNLLESGVLVCFVFLTVGIRSVLIVDRVKIEAERKTEMEDNALIEKACGYRCTEVTHCM